MRCARQCQVFINILIITTLLLLLQLSIIGAGTEQNRLHVVFKRQVFISTPPSHRLLSLTAWHRQDRTEQDRVYSMWHAASSYHHHPPLHLLFHHPHPLLPPSPNSWIQS